MIFIIIILEPSFIFIKAFLTNCFHVRYGNNYDVINLDINVK
jgi:hypothetical protein